MKIILMSLVFVFGALQPFQAGMNARMGRELGDRFQAGFINGFTNVLLLSMVLLLFWRGFPAPSLLKQAPWWAFLAGAIGAGIVVVQLSAAPVLGGAILVAFFVAGQVGGSVLVDSLGLVGYEQRPPSMMRLAALAMILGGVILATLSMRGDALDAKSVSPTDVPADVA